MLGTPDLVVSFSRMRGGEGIEGVIAELHRGAQPGWPRSEHTVPISSALRRESEQ
jgi:hypothetical protein